MLAFVVLLAGNFNGGWYQLIGVWLAFTLWPDFNRASGVGGFTLGA